MKFVYEEDSRAIVMRDTGDPKIEGDTVALLSVGYDVFGHDIAARMNIPTPVLDPDFREVAPV